VTEINREVMEQVIKLLGGNPQITSNQSLIAKNKESGTIIRVEVISNSPKKMLTEDIVLQVKDDEEKRVSSIMEATGEGKKSATLTYYCFIFTILNYLGYHVEDKNGKVRQISLNSFCNKFDRRRASLREPKDNCEDISANARHYHILDRRYRFLDLNNYTLSDGDDEELRNNIKHLKPIYNDLLERFN
jgi:hypothetical protein